MKIKILGIVTGICKPKSGEERQVEFWVFFSSQFILVGNPASQWGTQYGKTRRPSPKEQHPKWTAIIHMHVFLCVQFTHTCTVYTHKHTHTKSVIGIRDILIQLTGMLYIYKLMTRIWWVNRPLLSASKPLGKNCLPTYFHEDSLWLKQIFPLSIELPC